MISHSTPNAPLDPYEFKLFNRMADTMQSLVFALSKLYKNFTKSAHPAPMVSRAMECNIRGGEIITKAGRYVYKGVPKPVLGVLPKS